MGNEQGHRDWDSRSGLRLRLTTGTDADTEARTDNGQRHDGSKRCSRRKRRPGWAERSGSGWKRWWRRWPRLRSQGESLAEVAHDASNMVTALGLYCDLLEEPGVLATPFTALWKRAAAGGRGQPPAGGKAGGAGRQRDPRPRLIDAGAGSTRGRIALDASSERPGLDCSTSSPGRAANVHGRNRARAAGRWDLMPAAPIENLAAELLANRNLLAALAGPVDRADRGRRRAARSRCG